MNKYKTLMPTPDFLGEVGRVFTVSSPAQARVASVLWYWTKYQVLLAVDDVYVRNLDAPIPNKEDM